MAKQRKGKQRNATRIPGEGRKGPFTKEQNKVIEQFMTPWHQYSIVDNPGEDGGGKLTKWKQNKADEILQLPEFSVLPEGLDYKRSKEGIVRKFTNYRNARKRLIDDRAVELKALKDAAAALIDLKSFSTGRDLFKERNHDDVVARRTRILLTSPDKSKIGTYQKALAELWAEADQGYWEEEAKNVTKDIHKNREILQSALYYSLRGLCTAGGLGNMEMLCLYAFRDNTGRVESSFLEAHHDDDVESFKQSTGKVESFRLSFERWAKQVLPDQEENELDAARHIIECDQNGMPRFPVFDVDNENPNSLRILLQVYFEGVWEFCNPESAISWEEVSSSPASFYDIDTFELGAPFNQPSKMSTAQLYDMCRRLVKVSGPSSKLPFRFTSTFVPPPRGTTRPQELDPAVESTLTRFSPSAQTHRSLSEPCSPTSSTSANDGVIGSRLHHRDPSSPDSSSDLGKESERIGSSTLIPTVSQDVDEELDEEQPGSQTQGREPYPQHSTTDSPLLPGEGHFAPPSAHSSREGLTRANSPISHLHGSLHQDSHQTSPAKETKEVVTGFQRPASTRQVPDGNPLQQASEGPRHHHSPSRSPTPGLHPPPPTITREQELAAATTMAQAGEVNRLKPVLAGHDDSSSSPLTKLKGSSCGVSPRKEASQDGSGESGISTRPASVHPATDLSETGSHETGGQTIGGTSENAIKTRGRRGKVSAADGIPKVGNRSNKQHGEVEESRTSRRSHRATRSSAEQGKPRGKPAPLCGQKRPHPSSGPELDIYDRQLTLVDGRVGYFKKVKFHQGGYFHDERGDVEWMNEPWDAVRMPSLM